LFGPAVWLNAESCAWRQTKTVAFLGHGYDLDATVLALNRQGVRVRWFDVLRSPQADPIIAKQLTRQWENVRRQPEFWILLTRWGLERHPWAEAALEMWWRHVIPTLWTAYQYADRTFKRQLYTAAVAWEAGSGTFSAPMLQAAVAHHIPTVVYQHGSASQIDPQCSSWVAWQMHGQHLLLYGNGTKCHLERHLVTVTGDRPNLIPVGSARLDTLRVQYSPSRVAALRRRLVGRDSRPLILYIPTMFGTYGRALSGELVGYSPVSYFELQQQILQIVAEFPNVRLLYKNLIVSNGMYNPIPAFIRQVIPNAIVVNRPSVSQLMWAADAIILDHAVTALGEVLLTRKRIVLYSGAAHREHIEPIEAAAQLACRVSLTTTPEEFARQVRLLLTTGDFSEIPSPEQTYLCAYSTHLNDGHSAERAAQAIISVASK